MQVRGACRGRRTGRNGDRGVLWAREFRNFAKLGCEALGVTVVTDEVLGNVLEVKLPVSGYFKEALKEKKGKMLYRSPDLIEPQRKGYLIKRH